MLSDKNTAVCRLKNMAFFGHHGVTDAEKEIGCRLEIDCEYTIDIAQAAGTDLLEQTVDYFSVYKTIDNIVRNNKFNLIETLAQHIVDVILKSFDISWIRIKVRKIDPPVPGSVGSFEVEIERRR